MSEVTRAALAEPEHAKFCLACQKEGHDTTECWSTVALNSPAAWELDRLCKAWHESRRAALPKAPPPEQEARRIEILRHERDHARACLDRSVKILVGIHALLYPRVVHHEGKTYHFKSPIVEEQMQALSDRIRAIPDDLAAVEAGEPRAADEEQPLHPALRNIGRVVPMEVWERSLESEQTERAGFEKHYAKLFDLTTKQEFGGPQYIYPFVEAIWNGWRDHAKLSQESQAAPLVLPEPFGWFYELNRTDNPKAGPVYLGTADEKTARIVAADESAEPFPLYAAPLAPKQESQ